MQSIVPEDAAQQFAAIEPLETTYRRSISLGFSLQIISGEGLSLKGETFMNKTTTGVPQRASRPADVTEDFDDQLPNAMPRSQIRWRPTNQAQAGQDVLAPHGCTQEAAVPAVSHRVSGTTRAGLWVVLILCVAFLVNGIVLPAFNSLITQLHYGDARVVTYDLNNHHFLTEDTKGKVRIVITSQDGSHAQVLSSVLAGTLDHALVTLNQDGSSIDVAINGTQAATLVPDGNGGYKWGGN